ncbi:MAG: hypothetical protein AMJ72_02650 [Acidithiobacillales bacterium SM1_46]|nr:MAG: hypothetical protein AMJ72_02650 [Acidithiobacillales bacterium SM1_46]
MSTFSIPTCHYHATATERLAVKIIGDPIASKIDMIVQMREHERDPAMQRSLWSQAHFQYKKAVAEVRKRADCPDILKPRPDLK